MAIDPYDKGDIQSDIRRAEDLLQSGIFDPSNAQSALFRAAFVDLLIALRDLMYKTEKYSRRITFTDDVSLTDRVKDVTGLIKFVRDALCHPEIENHYFDGTDVKATFNVIFGAGSILRTPAFEQSSPHTDDICFFFGSQRVFLNRHIRRALAEAKQQLLPLL